MAKPRWIAHNQNCMPARLKPDTLVNVAFRDGDQHECLEASKHKVCWKVNNNKLCAADIIAYQIVEETK